MPPIGFVVLTHAKPHQTLRLVSRLNTLFGQPPIVCHHDFSKCALETSLFPPNVSFVEPHVQTAWAEYSIVEATMKALSQLHAGGRGPEWTVLLSGSCYPVKPAAQILHDLQHGGYDAYFTYELVPAPLPRSPLAEEFYRRYFKRAYRLPFLDRRLRVQWFPLRVKVSASRLPFSTSFRCFAGSHFFSANRQSVEYALDFHKTQHRLAAYFRTLLFPEEAYLQTILANAPEFKLNNSNGWYIDWSEQSYHPKSLTVADLPKIAASPAWFARKIDMDANEDLMDALDQITVPQVSVPTAQMSGERH